MRERADADIPQLVQVLAGQQPFSRYPFRWPLPFPAEQFIRRDGELAAWVAELDGDVVGHVSITQVTAGEMADSWSAAAGVPRDSLGCVSALFVAHDRQGHGIGGRLLDVAEEHVRAADLVPVLDVVQAHGTAKAVYLHRGWVEVGLARPDWLPDDEPPVSLMVLPT